MTGPAAGQAMLALIRRLYPLCRSVTGEGLRQTLRIIGETLPLAVTEVPSGTPVLDWTVPEEWNLRRARLIGPDGTTVVDTRDHNLHVLNYSVPVSATLPLAELRPHLHSLPERPDWIPYRTSYYARNWGFCLPHRQLETLPDGDYRVEIDTTLAPGALSYGEALLPGESGEEVLVSAHCCHPSLANDNLAGIAVAVALAGALRGRRLRYGYRFVFAPATIGAICWLHGNRGNVARIRHGLVLSCLGDPGPVTYKRSRRGVAEVDRAVEQVLRERAAPHVLKDFVPYGYDERQYCSPGFDLPVGALMRTPNGQYPEYHSSADNVEFLSATALEDSLATLLAVVEALELNDRYLNLAPYGEPQLGRRGLYAATGGQAAPPGYEMALLWVLSESDGRRDLLDISRRSGLALATIATAARQLEEKSLLRRLPPPGS